MYRRIENYIEEHLKSGSERILVIDGARQIGKSYSIRKVGSKLFKNFVEINMEDDRLGPQTFANARTTKDFYMALSTIAGEKLHEKENTLIFIDEIQAYDHLLTLLKFLREDSRFTYIASGSQLGIALNNTSSLPIGSIEIKHMYQMDFEEFLIANGVGSLALNAMKEAFENRESLSEAMHNKMMDFFRKYLIVGGLPEAVKTFVQSQNIAIVKRIHANIWDLYQRDASKYDKDHNLKIRRIYDMIPSVMENKKKRIVAKDIENKQGKRMSNYADEFDYLISSGVALEVKAISTPSFPLIQNSGKNLLKLYLNDVGLLSWVFYKTSIKAIMEDSRSVNLGSIYETVVAQELRSHGFNLFYYDNKNNGEVDFLIDDYCSLGVVPLEIKSGKDYTVHSALNKFLSNKDYHVPAAFVLSNERKVCQERNLTYLPIYYIMFFSNE